MLVTKAIERIRSATHDESYEYSNEECVFALNTAAHEIAALLIAGLAPIMAKEEVFSDGQTLPEGFFRTAGTYPLKVTGQTVNFIDGSKKMKIRYFFMPKEMTGAEQEEMPFDMEFLNGITLKVAVKMLLNENEFDITQDQAIQQELMTAVQSGWQGR